MKDSNEIAIICISCKVNAEFLFPTQIATGDLNNTLDDEPNSFGIEPRTVSDEGARCLGFSFYI